ncbi:MAG: AAA family ATPase [Alphaproteobacteria bacterium]
MIDRPIHVVAAIRSKAVVAVLGEVRTAMRGVELSLSAVPLADLHPSADLLQTPDVLLLEIDVNDTRDLDALERITCRHFPGVPVLVTAGEAALPVVRRLMRLGVVDFLPQPISLEDFKSALAYAAQPRRYTTKPAARGKVLAFLKAGGGVGATTLATQAAVSLAARWKQGRRDVCLLDLDIQFGAAALHLDLDDHIGLADLLDDPQRLDGELLRSVMSRHRGGLYLLASPREVVGLDAVTPELLDTCLALARTEYETVILDLPGVWTPWTYRAVQSCDLAILVTQLGVAGIRQARRQLDAMAANGLGEVAVHVAVNRFESGWRRHIGIKDAERALGRPIDYLIANDYRAVAAAIDQGVSLADVRPRSKAARDIRRMIDAALETFAKDSPVTAGTLPRLLGVRPA